MERKIVLLLFIILGGGFLFPSCKERTKVQYDSNGLTTKEFISLDGDSILAITYFKNGKIKEKGTLLDSVKVGVWEEWYPDGRLKWRGKWQSGQRVIDSFQQKPIIEFEHPVTKFKLDTFYTFRIYVEGLHPNDMFLVADSHVRMKLNSEKENYNYYILFSEMKKTKLSIYALHYKDEYFIGSVTIKP